MKMLGNYFHREKCMRRLIVIVLCFLTQLSFAASLSPTEIKMRDYLTHQQKDQIALLKKIVNINSGTGNIAGVHRVGEIMRSQFNQLRFKTRWVQEPAFLHRAGTLIAEHPGKGKKLLLIGHLDTVFPPESKFQPFVLDKQMAKGQGVLDDKGGIITILYALKALQAAHVFDDMSITVVLTGDEEDSGKPTSISRKPLVNVARNKDFALDFESGSSLSTASIARRGISHWEVEVNGNGAHSATIFRKGVGDGAIFELSRILNTMRTQLQDEKYLSFNPGLSIGGTKVDYNKKNFQGNVFGKENIIAKIALAKGDLRYIDPMQKDAVKARMTEIVNQHLPGTQATITFVDGIPAMPPTLKNLTLLGKYSEVSMALDQAPIIPLDPGLRGAGDISYVASVVYASLVGLGPVGSDEHSVTESMDINSLFIQTQRAAIFMYRLTR